MDHGLPQGDRVARFVEPFGYLAELLEGVGEEHGELLVGQGLLGLVRLELLPSVLVARHDLADDLLGRRIGERLVVGERLPYLAFCSSPGAKPKPQKELYFRSEEHTSELQSLIRISYAVFRMQKKKINI